MGSCSCVVHYHSEKDGIKKQESIITNNKGYDFLSLNSLKTSEKEKENEIKINLNKKIPQLGKIIHIKEYEQLINENILSIIKKNKLNFRNYLPKDLITYYSFPIQFKNNNVYYGNWNKNNEMEGYGIYYINEQKVVTEGIWIKGSIIFGRIFFPNGNIYEGEMKNSVPDGTGKLFFSNGESYIGTFRDGEITGKGNFNFADKTMYKGGLKNGAFNGEGKIKWSNGTEYHGHFVDSTLCGKGKIFNVQGEEYEGYFDKNEFHGEGIYSFSNGDIYEGNYEYGIKRGKGKYKRNDNIIFEGNWNDDLPNGNGIIYYKEYILKGFWRNGNIIGTPEIEGGIVDNFNNIDLNIRPYKTNINPNSLPHLSITDSNISQFIQNTDLKFI